MNTKTGKELNVIGQVQVNGIEHFIVKLNNNQYILDDIICNLVVLPASMFDVSNGYEHIEMINSDK